VVEAQPPKRSPQSTSTATAAVAGARPARKFVCGMVVVSVRVKCVEDRPGSPDAPGEQARGLAWRKNWANSTDIPTSIIFMKASFMPACALAFPDVLRVSTALASTGTTGEVAMRDCSHIERLHSHEETDAGG
jgi:hypothetical protein